MRPSGWPAWFGPGVRRAAAAGAAVATAALLCGWPYWRAHPGAAAVTLPGCAGLAVAGGVLAAGRTGRRTGALFLAGSGFWALLWLAAWNTGPAPLVSVFAQSAFYTLVGAAVLLYPAGRLTRPAERLWVIACAAVLFGGQLALCLLSRPEWNGFAPDATWPSVAPHHAVFDWTLGTMTALLITLAGALVVLLLARLPRTGRLDRPLTAPVALAISVIVVAGVWSQNSIMARGITLADVERAYLIQSLFAAVLPLVFLGTGLRGRLAELTVAERMQRLAAPPVTLEKVRDALRGVLHDESLDLWFWVPADDVHVDVAGRRVDTARPGAAPGPDPPGRLRHEVRTSAGEPLAIVDLSGALRGHEPLVAAALAAGGRALEAARLQATARAHLERARAAGEHLVRVQAAERERLAADLQASARRRLRTLDGRLAALARAADDPAARALADRCRAELAEAAAELDDLARGVHPALLTEAGLGPALAAVAGRSAAPIRLTVPPRRFPPEVESTLYFALCEALTNAVKHAGAATIALTVEAGPAAVVAEVRDDGAGGAAHQPSGGGLNGLTDRVRALRGTVTVTSAPGAGTTVTITLPAVS
ncbi:sensor histidine kinase [Spirillospora albida]|uniref:sensor histidine kinase n=1 Tax=Spirillospora albida TaxID=58123 RepID=UPI00068E1066|nr:ATP-binding protein [Spirillospora albida]